MSGNGNIYNFYGTNDYVQDVFGGINVQTSWNTPYIYGVTIPRNPSQVIDSPNVINTEVNQNPIRNGILNILHYVSPLGSEIGKIKFMIDTHSGMHSDKTLEQFIITKITNGK